MDKLTLVEQLNHLSQSTREKERIIDKELSRTKEEYHPQPQAKILIDAKKPNKAPVIILACLLSVFAILCVFVVANAVSSFSKSSDIIDFVDNPGEKYELWLESWDDAEYFSDLEESWSEVAADWKSRKIDVNWSYVEWSYLEELEGHSINSKDFSNQLLGDFSRQADKYTMAGVGKVFIALFLLISSLIFATKMKERYNTWRPKADEFNRISKENDIIRKYNEEELPKLLREWEEKAPEMYAKYEEEMAASQAKLAQLEEVISQYAHLLPEKYHYWADEIASFISCGSACDIQGAIKLYDEQREKEWEEQEVSRKEREKEREQNRKKYAAQDRCRNCARKYSCSYSVKDGFARTGDVCPSYRPR